MARNLKSMPNSTYYEFNDRQRRMFLRVYNETEAKSGYLWDRIGWISSPGIPIGLWIAGIGECVWHTAIARAAFFEPFLEASS